MPYGPLYSIDQTFGDARVKHLGKREPQYLACRPSHNAVAKLEQDGRAPAGFPQADRSAAHRVRFAGDEIAALAVEPQRSRPSRVVDGGFEPRLPAGGAGGSGGSHLSSPAAPWFGDDPFRCSQRANNTRAKRGPTNKARPTKKALGQAYAAMSAARMRKSGDTIPIRPRWRSA